ncbi:MAG: helix-turn-helix domain protein [Flaviaesturariibacter sp.]|nr:helix-turn-helix domain protein [Flaviaesturariibacter sp.]
MQEKTPKPEKKIIEPLNDEEQLRKIGARIKQLRQSAGYDSGEKFAFEHDIPRAQYSRYEKGENMRLTSFMKVLSALKVSYVDFFSKGFDD